MGELAASEESGRESFASYRELLDSYGFRPSRRLGQNFLLDKTLHRVLVDAVQPREGDLVLEIGAGLGFLTRELAGRCRVVAVEVDERLVRVLRAEITGYPRAGKSVRLVHRDVLVGSRIHPDVLAVVAEERSDQARRGGGGRFLLVANLPYAIAGPLLAEVAALEDPPEELAVLVQLELAQRLAAVPGTREYGALAVQLQLGYAVQLMRRVGAQVFRPRPRVDSAMVHLERLHGGCLSRPADERRAMAVFWRGLFASRRKKLRNAPGLRGVDLAALGELLSRRPDAVAPDELLALFDWWRERDPRPENP